MPSGHLTKAMEHHQVDWKNTIYKGAILYHSELLITRGFRTLGCHFVGDDHPRGCEKLGGISFFGSQSATDFRGKPVFFSQLSLIDQRGCLSKNHFTNLGMIPPILITIVVT